MNEAEDETTECQRRRLKISIGVVKNLSETLLKTCTSSSHVVTIVSGKPDCCQATANNIAKTNVTIKQYIILTCCEELYNFWSFLVFEDEQIIKDQQSTKYSYHNYKNVKKHDNPENSQ